MIDLENAPERILNVFGFDDGRQIFAVSYPGAPDRAVAFAEFSSDDTVSIRVMDKVMELANEALAARAAAERLKRMGNRIRCRVVADADVQRAVERTAYGHDAWKPISMTQVLIETADGDRRGAWMVGPGNPHKDWLDQRHLDWGSKVVKISDRHGGATLWEAR